MRVALPTDATGAAAFRLDCFQTLTAVKEEERQPYRRRRGSFLSVGYTVSCCKRRVTDDDSDVEEDMLLLQLPRRRGFFARATSTRACG